jgi:hypothetical protein
MGQMSSSPYITDLYHLNGLGNRLKRLSSALHSILQVRILSFHLLPKRRYVHSYIACRPCGSSRLPRLKVRSCWCDRFRMAWRRSSHATTDAGLSELELISPRGGFRFTQSEGDDREVLNRKLPRDKVLGLAALKLAMSSGQIYALATPSAEWPLFAHSYRSRIKDEGPQRVRNRTGLMSFDSGMLKPLPAPPP